MTREHKLALIVGFSLILLVGVLISDHLSRARQARIASVSPSETMVADAAVPPASDPLKSLESLTPPALTEAQPPSPTSLAAANGPGAPTTTTTPTPTAPADQLASEPPTRTVSSDAGLTETIIQQGGAVHRDANGNTVFTLPTAAGTARVADHRIHATGEAAPSSRIDTGKTAAASENIKIHSVKTGETLFQIATRYYGNGQVWPQLARYNGVQEKEGIVRVGMRLKIPTRDVLLGRAAEQKSASTPAAALAKPAPGKRPESAPARPMKIELATYTVRKGETLGAISRKVLGSSKRWQEIADLNRIGDEDNVQAGTVLKVPPMRG